MSDEWVDVGSTDDVPEGTVREFTLGHSRIAVIRRGDDWGAISGTCNHVGGPLGQGRLDGDYVVCPWHYWKFHWQTGAGEPGYEADRVPSHSIRIEAGRILVQRSAATPRDICRIRRIPWHVRQSARLVRSGCWGFPPRA